MKKQLKKRRQKNRNEKPLVAIVMGSDSDLSVMKDSVAALKRFKIPYELKVISAHRTPSELVEFAKGARSRGLKVIIAGAGGAAHLPGMVASLTELPVIGVPVPVGFLQGQDALLSIVQMPKGVPVATVAIGNAWNAAILAAQILGGSNEKILDLILKYKAEMRQAVLKKKI